MSEFSKGFHSALERIARDWENLSWPEFDLGTILEFLGWMTVHLLLAISIWAIIFGIGWCIFKIKVFLENRRKTA